MFEAQCESGPDVTVQFEAPATLTVHWEFPGSAALAAGVTLARLLYPHELTERRNIFTNPLPTAYVGSCVLT